MVDSILTCVKPSPMVVDTDRIIRMQIVTLESMVGGPLLS